MVRFQGLQSRVQNPNQEELFKMVITLNKLPGFKVDFKWFSFSPCDERQAMVRKVSIIGLIGPNIAHL